MKKLWNNIQCWVRSAKTYHQFINVVRCSKPYDWEYLMKIEQAYLKRMLCYMQESEYFDHSNNIKWMNMCIKLLDIIIDDEGQDSNRKMNYNNIDRFIRKPMKDGVLWDDVVDYYKKYPDDYRFVKSWYLYFEIRKNYTGNWWD